jgi:hypothetical protein
MSAFGGKADINRRQFDVCLLIQSGYSGQPRMPSAALYATASDRPSVLPLSAISVVFCRGTCGGASSPFLLAVWFPVIGFLSGALPETMREYVAAFKEGLASAGII